MQRQNPTLGVFWMIVTGLCFVAVTALVKAIGPGIPAAEMAFLRYVLGLVFLIPMLAPLWRAPLTRRHWKLFGLRGICHAGGVVLWFYAMTRISIAEVTAMNYLAPVYVTIGAVFVLGERLAARRIAAVICALIGALIILRPGFRALDPGHFAMFLTALVFAGSYLIAKILADEVPASAVVAMLSLTVPIALLPFALVDWVWPSWWQLTQLFGVAALATAGHYTMTLGLAAAPLTVTQPVTFLQLIWATALGALVFGEALDPWVILGGALIIGAVSFITWREAVLKRRPITPAQPATKI